SVQAPRSRTPVAPKQARRKLRRVVRLISGHSSFGARFHAPSKAEKAAGSCSLSGLFVSTVLPATACVLVALAEALHAAGRVHDPGLTCEVRVTLAADVQVDRLLGGARPPGVSAGANHRGFYVLGVDVRL